MWSLDLSPARPPRSVARPRYLALPVCLGSLRGSGWLRPAVPARLACPNLAFAALVTISARRAGGVAKTLIPDAGSLWW
jgi:hypothetical protein